MTVFVPVTIETARQLRSSGAATDLTGYAAGPALRRWLGEDRLDEEEADYVALNHAGVAALLLTDSSPTRLVLAVDQEPSAGADAGAGDDLGAIRVPTVAWSGVRSLFADEDSAAEAVTRARTAVFGLDLADALAHPVVAELLDAHDLLWFTPSELDVLARG